MIFPTPLITGILIKRYKRFLADVLLDSGETATAHCTSTGSMIGLAVPGAKVWLSRAEGPHRKLPYTWEMVEHEGTMVGVNTSHPNLLVQEAIQNGVLSEFEGYDGLKREVKYGKNSRIDILLTAPQRPACYIEIKNVYLKRGDLIEFPDAVTERGTKHLFELSDMVQQGYRAAMIYVVQREDGSEFAFAKDLDPLYAQTARHAFEMGVEFYAYACHMGEEGIRLSSRQLTVFG
jgi:sugar fermentation stimulation protein A